MCWKEYVLRLPKIHGPATAMNLQTKEEIFSAMVVYEKDNSLC